MYLFFNIAGKILKKANTTRRAMDCTDKASVVEVIC